MCSHTHTLAHSTYSTTKFVREQFEWLRTLKLSKPKATRQNGRSKKAINPNPYIKKQRLYCSSNDSSFNRFVECASIYEPVAS